MRNIESHSNSSAWRPGVIHSKVAIEQVSGDEAYKAFSRSRNLSRDC